jgi:ATP-dependent Clp protease ATP-binding subunit ClpA
MSHFTESHSINRLIGSPPGYVNHEEGGQLTNPLLNNPQTIVLLDEIEKAHPHVIKTFLPIFDEGFIVDTKSNFISCSETIFIMTSNLCSDEIVHFYNLGYSSEEILEAIEPYLMKVLSPELYNRVEPVLFRPLAKETMYNLVELMLDKVEKKLLMEKQIQIYIDDSLKDFLVENGYHLFLGARPLKKLIEKRVLSNLAYNIIKNGIESGSHIILFYDKDTDSVIMERIDLRASLKF